jgi:hypothetical protein
MRGAAKLSWSKALKSELKLDLKYCFRSCYAAIAAADSIAIQKSELSCASNGLGSLTEVVAGSSVKLKLANTQGAITFSLAYLI